jgi:hypothetical protein
LKDLAQFLRFFIDYVFCTPLESSLTPSKWQSGTIILETGSIALDRILATLEQKWGYFRAKISRGVVFYKVRKKNSAYNENYVMKGNWNVQSHTTCGRGEEGQDIAE